MSDLSKNEAKSAILESIRRSLAASLQFDPVHQEHAARQIAEKLPDFVPMEETESLTEIFRENFEAVGGNCQIAENKVQAIELVKDIVRRKNARKIAVSEAPICSGIKNALMPEAETIEKAPKEVLFECDLGITSAQFGAAETGTLVLESEKEHHRLTSLIPPVHVCLLETGKIRRTLGEVFKSLGDSNLSPAITFITGPSRTSDIELTLAIGVHGPAELFVILIEE